MKILYLIDDFPPTTWTSSGILTLNLAKKMAAAGHEVFVITTVQDPQAVGRETYQGLTIHRLFTNYPYQWRAYLSLYNPQAVSQVKKIIRKIKPDISHFQHLHQHLSYGCLKLAKKYSRAVFLTAHDAMLFHYGKLFPNQAGACIYQISWLEQLKQEKLRYNPCRNLIIRHYLKYVDKIFAISQVLQKVLAVNKIANTAVIYNSLEIDAWLAEPLKVQKFKNQHQLNNKKTILFGGRLSGAKGGEVILRAMERVIKKVPEAVLVVAGDSGQYLKEMMVLAGELAIKNQVVFTGWLDRLEMKTAFFSCDVCVTPSLCCDFFNLFNIEAGASGKPVVGTCFGGTPEIVLDGQTGYIVDPSNIELMAERIIELLKNPQRAQEFGAAGYRRVKENFSLERQVTETLKWHKMFIYEKN